MIGKTRNVGQKHMFLPNLVELVNPEHELSLLAEKLDWDGFESGLAGFPCDPSDLVHFRHRIGESGVEKILAASISIHGEKVLSEDTSIDTTVQPKNITYPTDTKLAVKIIEKSRQIADAEGADLR